MGRAQQAETLSKTKIFLARSGSASLKSTIPNDVVSGLKLKDGDELEWELLAEGNRIIAKVSKAKQVR